MADKRSEGRSDHPDIAIWSIIECSNKTTTGLTETVVYDRERLWRELPGADSTPSITRRLSKRVPEYELYAISLVEIVQTNLTASSLNANSPEYNSDTLLFLVGI